VEELLLTVEIKTTVLGNFVLEVTNTETEKVNECFSVEELNDFIQALNEINADKQLVVEWLESPEARPESINEVRMQMMTFEQKLAEEMEKEQGVPGAGPEQGGFNPDS
jgi:hypothetical protein